MLVNVSTLSWDAGEDEGEGEDEDEDEGDKIALANFNTAMRLICDCHSIAKTGRLTLVNSVCYNTLRN